MLRYLTAGESHGPALVAVLEGLPAGVPLDLERVNRDLWRRQQGYGRGPRMELEQDRAEVLCGLRAGRTLGSPLAMLIRNREWERWREVFQDPSRGRITRPRPGHADLAGMMKYGFDDARCVLERASARETAARVAVGAVCKQLLEQVGMSVFGYVVQIGPVRASLQDLPWEERWRRAESSPVRCPDPEAERRMVELIDRATARGDTLGGAFEVVARGVPPGLGSYVHWDRRLDGRLAQAIMSVPSVKAVEVGLGAEAAARWGSEVHDEIRYRPGHGLWRPTNFAGGLEGGVTNGQELVVRGFMKPIATLRRPLRSVDLEHMREEAAAVERSDICRVPSGAVIGEAAVAFELARALLEKFGGDSLEEIRRGLRRYLAGLPR